jgi:hypothetical protein
MRVARRVSGSVGVPTSSMAVSDSATEQFVHLVGDVSVVEEDVVEDQRRTKRRCPRVSGSRRNAARRRSVLGGDCRCRRRSLCRDQETDFRAVW